MTKEMDELKALREKVAQLEAEKENQGTSNNYLNEIKELKKRGKSTSGKITWKEVDDHKNIPLYHTNGVHIGKLVGPLHPENCEQVFQRFADVGIKLSIYKPTQEQVERYKETKEYKDLELKFSKNRLQRLKSKKESEIEKLTKQISKLTGMDEGKAMFIKSQGEVHKK